MEREGKKLANASPARNRAIRYVNTCMLSQKIERLGIAEAGFFFTGQMTFCHLANIAKSPK